MSTQHTHRRAARLTGLLSMGAAGVLVLAPVQASAGPAPAELDSVATAQGTGEDTMEAVAEVNEVSRDAGGQFVTLVYSIEYNGDDELYLGTVLDSHEDYRTFALAGTTLADNAGGMRYHPLSDAEDTCLCTGRAGSSVTDRLEPGEEEKVTYWAMYPVPEDVQTVDVEVPEFGEITDVPVE